jgi:hypothetical protein
MKNAMTQIIGWYGTFAIVTAYFLNSFKILDSGNIWYQLLNATGAIGVAVISFSKKAYQPMVLNIVWTVIGIIAIVNIVK